MIRDTFEIVTPENIPFSFTLAGPTIRVGAWLVDMLIIAGFTTLFACLIVTFSGATGVFTGALLAISGFAFQWGYGAVLEWAWNGQTLGKLMLGARVLRLDGLPITFAQAAIRNLLRIVDFFPGGYGLGVLCCVAHRHRQRLGDMAAGTIVVRAATGRETSAELAPATIDTWLVATPASAGSVSRPLSQVILALSLRRDRLPSETRRRLFEQVARLAENQTRLPREQHETAEHYALRWL